MDTSPEVTDENVSPKIIENYDGEDIELNEEMTYTIKGASEADVLAGSISNESPLGRGLLGAKTGDVVEIETPAGMLKFKILEIFAES